MESAIQAIKSWIGPSVVVSSRRVVIVRIKRHCALMGRYFRGISATEERMMARIWPFGHQKNR
jgi:hypothetical protein